MLKAHPASHKKVVSRSCVVWCVIYFSRSQKKHLGQKTQRRKDEDSTWQFCCLVRRFRLLLHKRKLSVRRRHHNFHTFLPFGLLIFNLGQITMNRARESFCEIVRTVDVITKNILVLFPHFEFQTHNKTLSQQVNGVDEEWRVSKCEVCSVSTNNRKASWLYKHWCYHAKRWLP